LSILHEGQTVADKYEVEALLGEGAFGEVYRVKHRIFGRQAMKVFKLPGVTREETERMMGEAIVLSRLSHPNIIKVFDADIVQTSRGIFGFFTMEYVAGGTLEKFWQSHGTKFVPLETTIDIITQVCRGLAAAHREDPPIIHRDVKPQNILVGYNKDGLLIRLSDFGLAKSVNPLTLAASVRGTWSFKARETLVNPQGESRAGDVFSLGATLYLLLTDKLPYAAKPGMDVMDPIRFEDPLEPPQYSNILVDDHLEKILRKALAVDRQKRFQHAGELQAALEAWKPLSQQKKLPDNAKSSVDISKAALGQHSSVNEAQARKFVADAMDAVKRAGRLQEAADLLEQAINRWPPLRRQYERRLQLWRSGKVG
jgi:serine/threonine-protein kinase